MESGKKNGPPLLLTSACGKVLHSDFPVNYLAAKQEVFFSVLHIVFAEVRLSFSAFLCRMCAWWAQFLLHCGVCSLVLRCRCTPMRVLLRFCSLFVYSCVCRGFGVKHLLYCGVKAVGYHLENSLDIDAPRNMC